MLNFDDQTLVEQSPAEERLHENVTNITVMTVNAAAFQSQAVPVAMTSGQSYDVEITMHNIGNTTWTVEDGYQLGSQAPLDNMSWGRKRVPLPSGVTVEPGAQVTFAFKVTAPATAGAYDFQWRMLREGVAWFGDQSAQLTIQVTSVSELATKLDALISKFQALASKVDKNPSSDNAGDSTEADSSGIAALHRSVLTDEIDALFKPWDNPASPGCALAIYQDGRTIYARGYGAANLENRFPLTPATVFHIASVAKQFVAMAILLLAEDGRLKLDDGIRLYISELPDYCSKITIRHLLHHTSGLCDDWRLLHSVVWRENYLKTQDALMEFAVREELREVHPGEKFTYCNIGYSLLEIVVQRVSGASLREYAAAHIFDPLGMQNTGFYYDHTLIVRNRAYAYRPQPHGDGFRVEPPNFNPLGESSLFTNVEDLGQWAKNFYDRWVGGDAVIEQMLTPGRLNNGHEIPYAAGLIIRSHRGFKTFEHGGADQGYRAFYIRFPERRFSIAILCNLATIDQGRLALQVANIILRSQKS